MCFFFKLIMTPSLSFFFFFNDTATTEIYTLSLHDALPICGGVLALVRYQRRDHLGVPARLRPHFEHARIRANAEEQQRLLDRKSTRLNSSHSQISYAVFCLKKKKKREACRLVFCRWQRMQR